MVAPAARAAPPAPEDQESVQGKSEAPAFEEQAAPAPVSRTKAREEFWSSEPQIVEGSRRGDSARQQFTNAYEECNFPPYPAEVEPGEFSLPKGMVDTQAPLSARKWELAVSLASFAKSLSAKRQDMHDALFNGRADQIDEYDNKRVRRPTAIMRQNVEVARMMGVPGTKQKHISHDAMGEDKPAPQHLSRQKERPAPERSRAVAPARTPASKETKEASGVGGSGGVGGGGGGSHRDKRSKETSPGVPGSGGKLGTPLGKKQARSLPVLSQLPPTCLVDKGVPITLATVQAVLGAGSPMPALPVPPRRVQATVLAPEPSDGKRKRRPPGWLDGHTQEGRTPTLALTPNPNPNPNPTS